jgi:hypothetical protein
MSNILNHSMPALEIACWIMEIERDYPTLPNSEQSIARKQLQELRAELGIQHELARTEAEQRYFADVEIYAATIEPDGFGLPF